MPSTPRRFLKNLTVTNGRLTLPSGMSYRVLLLPPTDRMTPAVLRKIKDLAAAGATVLGARPIKSPSLSGFPKCDAEVADLANELWGDNSAALPAPNPSAMAAWSGANHWPTCSPNRE